MEKFNPMSPESQEPNPETLQFKENFEQVSAAVESIVRRLKERQAEGFTDFLDENDVGKLFHMAEGSKTVDFSSPQAFDAAHELLGSADECVKSINLMPSGGRGAFDDAESLKSLAWDLKNLSDATANLDLAAKSLNDEAAAQRLFQISNALSQSALEKAEYVASRADALDAYSR